MAVESVNGSNSNTGLYTSAAGTGTEAEALSHVIPLSKVVKEGAKKGKVNNLYGTWVVEGEVTVIAGDTNAGKSSVTYQMGLDAASGKNTLGFPAPVKPVVDEVVYIDTELSITQLGHMVSTRLTAPAVIVEASSTLS